MTPVVASRNSPVPERRTIPFDYAFRFALSGRREAIQSQTLTVSVESPFVALAIGHGVIPEVTPVRFGPTAPPTPINGNNTSLAKVTFEQVLTGLGEALGRSGAVLRGQTGPEAALLSGVRLNPELAEVVLAAQDEPLEQSVRARLFEVVAPVADQIQFLYTLHDDATGRSFQSDPLLSTAGLGIANGDRPFRRFARPIVFAPRSTIRMEITELSEARGELHVSLQGYKVLGGVGTPTATMQRRPRRR